MSFLNQEAKAEKGFFYPKESKKIYKCQISDTKGFAIETTLYGVLFGVFTVWLMGDLGIILMIFSWFIIAHWTSTRKYKYVQINFHTIVFGSGSVLNFLLSGFTTMYKMEKFKYDELEYILFNKWIKKKKSFGQIESKINKNKFFQIQIDSSDLPKIIKELDKHRFSVRPKPKKLKKKDEYMIVFPKSARYDTVEVKKNK